MRPPGQHCATFSYQCVDEDGCVVSEDCPGGLTAVQPETSTGNTLYALIGEDSIQDPERGNAVLLITGGNENEECQTVTDAADAAGKLLAQDPSVRTFAVGVIGSLADVATAGGTTMPYNANNPATLEAALKGGVRGDQGRDGDRRRRGVRLRLPGAGLISASTWRAR